MVLGALVLLAMRAESRSSVASEVRKVGADGRLAIQVFDRRGNPIVARVRVAPTHWAERVRLGLVQDVSHVVAERGLELAVAPGTYRVFVSRGPEWSLRELDWRAESGALVQRRIELEHEIELPDWHGADLHVHTDKSPDAADHGGVTALALRAEGVELAVGTDHNQIGDLGSGIDSVAGAEITTWDPEIGHFNAFPLQRLPRWRGTNPRELISELTRDTNVFVQINHPRLDDHIAYFALGGFDGSRFVHGDYHLDVDGVELWNGYDLARPERVRTLLHEWRRWIAAGHRLTATGGSDSHGVPGHLPGYPRTYVLATRSDELAPQLKRGHAFVSNGPLLGLTVDGASPGSRIPVRPGADLTVDVTVRAASWLRVDTVELWADERLVWSALPAPGQGRPLDYSARVRLSLPEARTLHAVAHGGEGLAALLGREVEPLAFTNAVYLDHAAVAVAHRSEQTGSGCLALEVGRPDVPVPEHCERDRDRENVGERATRLEQR